jgi:hypothetical protein
MKQELSDLLSGMDAHATIDIGADRWKVYIFGVSRVAADVFLQVAVVGPRVCTLTVRARAPIGNRFTARRVIAGIRDWVLSGDEGTQAYLELHDANERAS